jgi:predicted dehydrogenase
MVEIIRSGALGRVREVHVWTDRPIWPQGIERPAGTPAVPDTLDWDLWLGPAPERPYHPCYVPFNWRGWWDFGTGALGDMGCHNLDLAFFSLGLRDPVRVSAESAPVSVETAPKWSIVTTEFPAAGERGPVKLVWYDGKKKPPAESAGGAALADNGVIMVGDKDTLHVPHFWGAGRFLSGRTIKDFPDVPETLPRRSEKFDANHYQEWIAACKGGPAALSNFDYAGPMTEAVLLGNVALRAGEPIEFDAARLKVTNSAKGDALLRREYRKGWTL